MNREAFSKEGWRQGWGVAGKGDEARVPQMERLKMVPSGTIHGSGSNLKNWRRGREVGEQGPGQASEDVLAELLLNFIVGG